MLYFIIALLAVICVILLLRLCAVEAGLRKAAAQMRERQRTGSTQRLGMATPNAALEELLEAFNQLLELRQMEEADYRERELVLRRQIANISHDLRTPLTSILGYLQLLEGEGLTAEERKEYLAVVESRAKALQSLIAGFYDLSRLEGGEYPLARERVNLYSVLSGLLAAFYGDFHAAGLLVRVEMEPGLPPVWGDQAAVTRIFTNLIRNALDHGERTLEVRVFRQGKEIVSVFANGAGKLTKKDVAHVFDRFFTADKNRTGRNTGLGLAIVKELTEQMGHRVHAALRGDQFVLSIEWRQVSPTVT